MTFVLYHPVFIRIIIYSTVHIGRLPAYGCVGHTLLYMKTLFLNLLDKLCSECWDRHRSHSVGRIWGTHAVTTEKVLYTADIMNDVCENGVTSDVGTVCVHCLAIHWCSSLAHRKFVASRKWLLPAGLRLLIKALIMRGLWLYRPV